MNVMTPEQWNQLITILIASIGGLVTFIGLIGRVLYVWLQARIDNYAKDQQSERDKIRDENRLKFAALEDEAKTKAELFTSIKAHANSYEMVAFSVDKFADKIGDALSDTKAQIEIFSSQLQGVRDTVQDSHNTLGLGMTEVVQVVNKASDKVDALIIRIADFFNDLIDRDEASTNSSTQHRQEILQAVRSLQKDMEILQTVQRELGDIKGKVSRLVDTQPIPTITEASNSTNADDRKQANIEDIEDIA